MADIQARQDAPAATVARSARATLPFGGDKWGRDVLKKTIKGAETSIFVGLVAAAARGVARHAVRRARGLLRRWVDDVFNWFYSVFSSIPSICC